MRGILRGTTRIHFLQGIGRSQGPVSPILRAASADERPNALEGMEAACTSRVHAKERHGAPIGVRRKNAKKTSQSNATGAMASLMASLNDKSAVNESVSFHPDDRKLFVIHMPSSGGNDLSTCRAAQAKRMERSHGGSPSP